MSAPHLPFGAGRQAGSWAVLLLTAAVAGSSVSAAERTVLRYSLPPLDTKPSLHLESPPLFGDWQADAAGAYRLAPALWRSQPPLWAVRAQFSGPLAAAVPALSWQRGEPSWLLPETQQISDRFALSVDLSPWLAGGWAPGKPSLSMSVNWMRAENAEGRQEAESLNWNLALPLP